MSCLMLSAPASTSSVERTNDKGLATLGAMSWADHQGSLAASAVAGLAGVTYPFASSSLRA